MKKSFLLTIVDENIKHCSNCKYCTDEFIDTETNRAYMWFCYHDKDTSKGIIGECDMFDNDWIVRRVEYNSEVNNYDD